MVTKKDMDELFILLELPCDARKAEVLAKGMVLLLDFDLCPLAREKIVALCQARGIEPQFRCRTRSVEVWTTVGEISAASSQ